MAHVLEVDVVDVCGHPHAARDLEEGHVPGLRAEDVLVEHGLRLVRARRRVRARARARVRARVRVRVGTWRAPRARGSP